MSELDYTLDQIASVVGSGTQLVSLYVPSDKSTQSVLNRIQSESAEAENIKSKSTRDGVQRALQLTIRGLQQIGEDDAAVIFAGRDRDDEEHLHVVTDVPVPSFRYRCDSEFLTEPVRRAANDDSIYGLIVVERRAGTIGRLAGDTIEHVRDLESDAKGKHNAGGFSNRRFDRLIEESTSNFYDDVADAASNAFDVDRLDGIIVGGSNLTKDDFLSELPKQYRDIVIGTFSVEYHGSEGLEELVRRADESITDAGEQTARRCCRTFFDRLRSGEPVEYGHDSVERAAEMGAVDTLLVEPDVLYGDGVNCAETVEQMGGDVVEIPRTFEDGQRFCELSGGIGAICRYPVN